MNSKQNSLFYLKVCALSCALISAGLVGFYQAHADTIRVVAKYQTAVPSVPSANIYQVLGYGGAEPPIVSKTGKVLFKAKLQGQGVSGFGTNAVLVEDLPGQLRLLARGLDAIAVPGLSDATFQDFSAIQLGEGGRALFRGRIGGTGVTSSNDLLLCVADAGGPNCPIRKGSPDVGTFSEELPQEGSDYLSFKSTGAVSSSALRRWNASLGGNAVIAQVNAIAPGTAGALFGLSIPRLYTRGLSFHLVSSGLTGNGVTTANDVGLWSGTGGNFSLLVREGNSVPGLPGATFSSVLESTRPPVLSKTGVVAFTGGLTGTAVTAGIFRFQNGQLQPVVFIGDSVASELGEGVVFSSVAPTGISKNIYLADDSFGTLFLVAEVSGPGIGTSNNRTIWRFGPQGRELIARGGQEIAPGWQLQNAALGVTLRTNSSQDIAFRAALTGSSLPIGETRTAIIRSAGSNLHLLVRDGGGFTATVGTETYRIISTTWTTMFQFNELGQILFSGTATKDSLNESGSPAIVAIDQNRQLHLVAGHSEFFQVEPTGETMRLASFSHSDTATLSDNGDVVFAASISFGPPGNNAILRHTIETSPQCRADFNGDGTPTSQDLFDFLAAFFTPALSADMDDSGAISVQDIYTFLEIWFRGC